MTDKLDVWRSAVLLLKHYGDNALGQAERRRNQLNSAGDQAGAATWDAVILAIHALQKARPDKAS